MAKEISLKSVFLMLCVLLLVGSNNAFSKSERGSNEVSEHCGIKLDLPWGFGAQGCGYDEDSMEAFTLEIYSPSVPMTLHSSPITTGESLQSLINNDLKRFNFRQKKLKSVPYKNKQVVIYKLESKKELNRLRGYLEDNNHFLVFDAAGGEHFDQVYADFIVFINSVNK
jgi:hypothetical protein